ncbi:hypothetical protein Poly30_53990 [Planctomycetes bacterium Poly30]|uniref:AlgX/AlgJ SGNH hydrolase-like domain-containing protein n=1 Tax=Saltatorellus ferox TaxID=2528018 RepID=A0A518F0J2_9BACT|nr:hypothetical protein Poly30_53990 [Planctomycetes bacterium Poly30]
MGDVLIQPDVGSGRVRAQRFVAGAFLAVIIATGAAEVIFPPPRVVLLGQEKRDFDEAAKQKDFWDGSLAQSLETDFRLQGRVRRLLAPYWSALMLNLGDTPDDELIVGKDGWLFLRARVELRPARMDRGRELLANLYSLVRRSFASENVEFLCVPIPRKASICAEKLPDGIDGDMAYDRSVVEAFEARGIHTIDLIPHLETLPAHGRYLRHDTHWALPARLETAEQIKRQAPELPRGEFAEGFSHTYGADHFPSGLLAFAGIDLRHPAKEYFQGAPDRELKLVPAGAEEKIDAHEIPSDVLYVGSSFSAGFWMRAILCEALQSAVVDGSEFGQQPLYSLHKRLTSERRTWTPRYVVSEVPIYQAVDVTRLTTPTTRSALGIAMLMNYAERVQEIPDGYFDAPKTRTPAVGSPLVQHMQGTLLSSGDGVLGLGLVFDGESRSRWQFSTSGTAIELAARKGQLERVLPICETTPGIAGFAWLSPLSKESLGTSVKTRIVTTADLAGGWKFRGETRGDRAWEATPRRAIAACDSLALRWDEFVSGSIEVRATGTDRAGIAVERVWSFPDASHARFLIVTLGLFEGGILERIDLTGGGTHVEGTIAGLIGSS